MQLPLKDTSYVWGKKQQNLQLLYILASYSANKPSFHINRVIDQNIQNLLFCAVFASYIASILKCETLSTGFADTQPMLSWEAGILNFTEPFDNQRSFCICKGMTINDLEAGEEKIEEK